MLSTGTKWHDGTKHNTWQHHSPTTVHSITNDNESGFATGWLSGVLSDEGIRWAQNVARTVKDRTYDVIVSSDLARAIESAQLFFGEMFQGYTDARLREIDYGEFTGQPASLFKQDMSLYIDTPFPSGESYHDVQVRVEDFLHDVVHNYAEKHIAIVGHQATQLALEVLLKGKTWQQAIEEDWRKTQSWQPGWEYLIQ